MTAIEAMKQELKRIGIEMNECTFDNGFVKPWRKYRYKELVEEYRKFQESIEWMQNNAVDLSKIKKF